MKKFAFLFVAIMLLCTACEDKQVVCTADFEDVTLENGSFYKNTFESGGILFSNSYNAEYDSWEGFATSAKYDTETGDYTNQFSVIAGKAASGKNFGVVYHGMETPHFVMKSGAVELQSMMVCNTTYTYMTIKNGSDFSKKFAEGDWYKMEIAGYAGGVPCGTVEVYLADFRDGKSFIMNEWTKVDLTSLGLCDKVSIIMSSTDMSDWGMNTPGYAAIDDVRYQVEDKK